MTLPLATVIRPRHLPHLSGTASDAEITTLIAAADNVLATWCGWPRAGAAATLESATYTDYYDGPSHGDPTVLSLRVRPVASITSIHDDRDRDWAYGASDLVDSGDYVLDGEAGRVYLTSSSTHGVWSRGNRVLKAIYVAGYDTGAESFIAEAIGVLVAHWWGLRPTQGRTNVTQGGQSAAMRAETIPARCKELISGAVLPEAFCV